MSVVVALDPTNGCVNESPPPAVSDSQPNLPAVHVSMNSLAHVSSPAPKRRVVDAEPVFEILKSVDVAKAAVEEEITNSDEPLYDEDAAKSEKRAKGDVVPRPMLPLFATMKSVFVEEPTTNCGAESALPFTERSPQGDDDPTPKKPALVNVEVAVPPK